MITKIHIQNFKSILDYTLELGRINVFIGENGAGKTNILEAFATASAAADGTLERLTGLIEQGLGYRPFPSQWASLPLPELRVSYLKREQPTLLTSLLSDHLENLP